jgi:hypothetical protein
MTTDVSAALATLQLHPEDSQALKALAAIHPGNGAGIDADVLSKALSDARRFHRERATTSWSSPDRSRAGVERRRPRPRRPAAREGRVLSDELLRDEAGVAACARRWTRARTRRRHRSRWRR